MRNWGEVEKLIYKTQEKLDREAALTAENRFWSEGVARIITAGIILKRMGLVNYDMGNLFKWCVRVVKSNKDAMSADASSCESIAAEYIQSQWANTLRIKSTEDRRGKENGNGLDQLVICLLYTSPSPRDS